MLHSLVTKILLIDFRDYDDEDRTPSSVAGPGSEQAGTLQVMTDIAVSDSMGAGGTATTDDRVRILDQAARFSAKCDWIRLAIVVDRFFFVIFAVIMICTCLAFTGYL